MKKSLLLSLLLFPLFGQAANLPCSGNKGGINHCESSKFICNDGTTSASTKDCSVVMGITQPTVNTAPVSTSKPHTPVTTTTPATNNSALMKLDYEGFSVWLDCEKRGAVKFQYNAQRDTGKFPREEKFTLDPSLLTKSGFTTITTEIKPLDIFYYAEEDHQQYLAKNPDGYCGLKGTGVCFES